ncbi:hypothetical protein [Rheinheimera sp. MM224]|uniref:hypothetical protein n=1 Tax=Rheinheimera sp. MM224 TaxID=3019969 RepID=UPI0021F8D669|nr:hypothetical protein [Rheinheimera sp. MM224]CAI3805448.1 hypothetical protein JAMGFMIE_03875 [Rheinheimera sp. MM224]
MTPYIAECSQRAQKSINELKNAGLEADLLEISSDVWGLIQMGGFNHFPGRDVFAGLPVKLVNSPQNYIKALSTPDLLSWTVYYDTPQFPGKFFAIEFKGGVTTYESFDSINFENVRQWVLDRAALIGRREQLTQYGRQESNNPQIYCSFM